jgi:Tol biopolymer transport system component
MMPKLISIPKCKKMVSIRVFVVFLLIIIAMTLQVFGLDRNGKIVFTRGQDVWPSHIYVMNFDGSALTRLSAPTIAPMDKDPVWSPDGTRIAFTSSGFNDLEDIFVMNADGSGRIQLTNGGSYLTYNSSRAPSWSPDGSKIAFLGWRGGPNEVFSGLFVMNADGSGERLLHANIGCCSPPSWAPDSIQIAFTCEGGYSICTINTENGSLKSVTGSGWYQWEVGEPAWSPDGSMIAFLRIPYEGFYGSPDVVNEIWLIHMISGGALENLTKTRDVIEFDPAWLPDGTGLVFGACCGSDGDYSRIYKINKDGSGRVRLTDPPTASLNDMSPNVQSVGIKNRIADFDGDGRTDLAVWRPDEGRWYLNNSTGYTEINWGLKGDRIVAGNYDSDDKADFAVFRPSNNKWYRVHSQDGSIHETEWGLSGDLTVPQDYDGDGKNDLSVWRPVEGRWYINTGSAYYSFGWGLPGDKPVPQDYDNDGDSDLAVFRSGKWYILDPFTGSMRFEEWGLPDDIPVPADYDGDGEIDIAVFRPSEGRWYIKYSASGNTGSIDWGMEGDTPVPGDYDADGKTDIAVFRTSNGFWYRRMSRLGTLSVLQWGLEGDAPAPEVQME